MGMTVLLAALGLTLAACNNAGTSSATTASSSAPPPASTPAAPFGAPSPSGPSSTVAPSPTPLTPAASANAVALLATLPVRPSAGLAGYTRDQFGPAWADVNHNGCDTRNDILKRDLTQTTWRAGTHDCVVISGILADPYSGTVIAFTKAQATAIQIDHLVPLADAWSTGAQAWSASRREQFANDPIELLAVSGPLNEAKGDKNASAWLPPNTSFDCSYVTRQVDVKAAYGLWVTSAEHDAIATILAHCGLTASTAPAATTAPVATAPTVATAGTVYYPNCAAVRVAGKAPLRVGDPGYRSGLDANHNGVACE